MGMIQSSMLFLIMFFFVAIFGVTVLLNNRFRVRELEHKEKLAALEKGVDLPAQQSAPWTPRTYLLHGMIWLFAGLASVFAIFAIAATSTRPPSVEDKLRAVSDARVRGATPEEIQMLLNEPSRNREGMPVGLAMLGLIPVGVGLAYLIFYRVETRKLLS
jgi:hypothetical protein